jgi:hypothetical protein
MEMDDCRRVVHYYHANADAFGGRIETPFSQVLPVLAPSSLPVVGGYQSARHENFRVGEIISIERAYTQVAGVFHPGRCGRIGSFSTLVTSVIEGLNVNNTFFADRIVVQLATDHPADLIPDEQDPEGPGRVGFFPRVSLVGSDFTGLRLGTATLNAELRLDLFSDGDPNRYPTESWLHNRRFRQFAQNQSEQYARAATDHPQSSRPFLSRILQRHSDGGPNSDERVEDRGNVIVSVVENIQVDGPFDGIKVGNMIELSQFGRIFLGELIVDHDSFDLNMVRLDLGCAAAAQTSGPHGSANGTNTHGG